MIAPIIITYLGLSVLVAAFAINRRISFAGAFFTSLFLSPLVGLVAIVKSDKKVRIKSFTTRFTCPKCNFEYTENIIHCPLCEERGKKHRLIPNKLFLLE